MLKQWKLVGSVREMVLAEVWCFDSTIVIQNNKQ